MDLALSETQLMLQDVVREFIEREVPKSRVREIDESATGFDRALWKQMAGLGLPAMAVPDDLGGTASSLLDLAVVFESLGEGACPSPLLAGALCAYAVLATGDRDKQQELLPALASGERMMTLALTEPDYGWDAAAVRLVARRDGGSFRLSGRKLFVPYANVADELLVVARTASDGGASDGITLMHVAADTPGIAVRRQSGWLSEPACEVAFEDVDVPESAVVGDVGTAWPAVESALDRTAVLLCAYMLGGTQRVVDMAVEYSKTRTAFGVPIGTFQRVQDLVISALNDADAIRWSTYEAVWKLDEARDDASLAVSMAKAIASEGFPRACENVHYVHAGVGMDLDYGLTNYTVRSRFLSLYLGDANYHKLRMARLLDL